ncbi:hypothetical protein K461DRAFT_325076 [Myriangium duriaei CBS 260.36]|uniref:DUF4246 domain-containing protein n=1 Tax=Myriangium duriaei CBS 260.36 TaxID=1168546 RepID=A0A9P4IWR3_9PEZI|nr:hypothetical protein K461DRAFT_325076 [Myriangium duriaei CBS 260.36]
MIQVSRKTDHEASERLQPEARATVNDSSNITDSYLAFREATSTEELEEKPYDQEDYQQFERLYGIEQHGPATQKLGRVNTREGRLLTFPNVLQHQVSPFALADPSRLGHRKILALFLVDSYTGISSTANVMDLPPELAKRVANSIDDFPIELKEAKKLRLELMDERNVFVRDHNTRLKQEEFSFCEHCSTVAKA